MKNLSNFTFLQDLNLEKNFIRIIDGLENMKDIKVLELGFNKIESLEKIQFCNKLR